MKFATTREIPVPKDPFQQIIGQEKIVKVAKIATKQKRHLLLVGPPGTGKSMIAQAMASIVPQPTMEIVVVHNKEKAERPLLKVLRREDVERKSNLQKNVGKIVGIAEVPSSVAEKLGLRCRRCGGLTNSYILECPYCGAIKHVNRKKYYEYGPYRNEETVVCTSELTADGRKQRVVYERLPNDTIRVLKEKDLKLLEALENERESKVIVPLTRKTFVQATGASETELLGDVIHDPYGGHPELGSLPFMRVVPGVVHEAHEGVLFIDELSSLGELQRYLFTAMQEKKFPIIGRNPTSTGAIVRVDDVPCDFIFVGAININDLNSILPSLRSRIRGEGYELLMETFMEDNKHNREKLAQFVSQEVNKDGKIPHATADAVDEIILQAKAIAKRIDGVNGITLRLRSLSGLIKLAGDVAISNGDEYIKRKHIRIAVREAKSVEEQIEEKYETWWKAGEVDYAIGRKRAGTETT